MHNFRASPNEKILEISASAIGSRDFAMRSKFDETSQVITQLNKLQRTVKANSLASIANCTSAVNDADLTTIKHSSAEQATSAANCAIVTNSILHQTFRTALHNSMQTRGFKTHRNIDSKLRRDPSFSSRLQDLMNGKML